MGQSRRTWRAVVGSLVWLVLAPGLVVGLLPWLLTAWERGDSPVGLRWVGGMLVAVGVAVLLHAFATFAFKGLGTPAPAAPTEVLVIVGLYRWVRNPMYIAVLTAIAGQALLLGRPVLWLYGALIALTFVAFVQWYEQPTLTRQHGAAYETYRQTVPGWLPRRPR